MGVQLKKKLYSKGELGVQLMKKLIMCIMTRGVADIFMGLLYFG